LMSMLNKAEMQLDRKVLAEIALSDPAGFTRIVEAAKAQA